MEILLVARLIGKNPTELSTLVEKKTPNLMNAHILIMGGTAMQRKAMCRISARRHEKGALLWQPSKFPELI